MVWNLEHSLKFCSFTCGGFAIIEYNRSILTDNRRFATMAIRPMSRVHEGIKVILSRDRPKVKKPKFSEDRRLHIFLTDSTEDRRPKTETEDRRPKTEDQNLFIILKFLQNQQAKKNLTKNLEKLKNLKNIPCPAIMP